MLLSVVVCAEKARSGRCNASGIDENCIRGLRYFSCRFFFPLLFSYYSTSESIIIIISLLRNDALRRQHPKNILATPPIHSFKFLDFRLTFFLLRLCALPSTVAWSACCASPFPLPRVFNLLTHEHPKTKKCYLDFNDVREMMVERKKYQKRSGLREGPWTVLGHPWEHWENVPQIPSPMFLLLQHPR